MLISEGRQTAPTSGTLLAEIVTTDPATVYPQVYVSSAVVGAVRIQHRNAANDASIEEFYVDLAARSVILVPFTVNLDTAERIRIVTDTTFLGPVQGGFLS